MSDEQKPEGNEAEAGDEVKLAAAEAVNDEGSVDSDGFEDSPQTEAAEGDDEDEPEEKTSRPPVKLERLQKILAQAGVSSRRRAEELIEQGRVQVNGKIVTELGTKADGGRDHIRVDGKLLQGAERLRYFVLNKPKGFVTTVKDPEGRPTVMQFFEKMRERLYPVGRLDYMSEGLLLVTNDGELANRLTKAASGVEKTYLVKVSGQPTEAELDILRSGVSIERGKPGSAQVRTSPARIRQVRQGDNPWYEVVLIEGRNRELRKMFEEVGHFVEKIRRVGYGPLVLDQEPGNLRELEPEELADLQKAAAGKARTLRSKEIRRRNEMDKQLPTLAPKPTGRPRPLPPIDESPAAGQTREFRPKRTFGADRAARPSGEGFRKGAGGTESRPAFGSGSRPAAGRPESSTSRRPGATSRQAGTSRTGSGKFGSPRYGQSPPAWQKDDPTERPAVRSAAGPRSEERPRSDASGAGFRGPSGPRAGRPGAGGEGRKFGAKPAWKKPGGTNRPAFNKPVPPRRERAEEPEDLSPPRPSRLQIEAIEPERPGADRPARAPYSRPAGNRPNSPRQDSGRASASRPSSNRPSGGRSSTGRPSFNRPTYGKPSHNQSGATSGRPRPDLPDFDRSSPDRPTFDRPKFQRPRSERAGSDRFGGGPGRTGAGASDNPRPARGESGLARPFTTSSGKPRAGGARPSSKPSKGGEYGSGSRPAPGRRSDARPAGKTAWKPKPSFGGKPGSSSGGRSFGSKPGGASKSGYKGKPSSGGAGAKRSGPRPGGARPGGARPGAPRPGGKRTGPRPGGKRG